MLDFLPLEFDRPLAACPLCSAASIRPYDRDFRGVKISRCGRCGVKFMNPQYTDGYLSAFYAQYITPDEPEELGAELMAVELQRRVENFAMIEQFVPVGRLFSIGCGYGKELVVARQARLERRRIRRGSGARPERCRRS